MRTAVSTKKQKFKKIPLRLVLILPFVLQIFGMVGLTGYLSLRNGQKAVNDLATKLRSEVSSRIEKRLLRTKRVLKLSKIKLKTVAGLTLQLLLV
jgi:hypothetical protein